MYVKSYIFLFLRFFSFIWERGRERESAQAGRGAEGRREEGSPLSKEPHVGLDLRTLGLWLNQRQTLKQTPKPSIKPDMGLNLTTLRSWTELISRVRHSINWATQAPLEYFYVEEKVILTLMMNNKNNYNKKLPVSEYWTYFGLHAGIFISIILLNS